MCQDKLVRNHVQLDIETPELFERQKNISIFVKDGTVYFILASRLNSILNMKLSLDYGIISRTFCHYFAIVLSSRNDKMAAKRYANQHQNAP